MDGEGNGHNGDGTGANEHEIDRLTLTFNRVAFTLDIKGHVHSLDSAIAMLDMAKREYERQLKSQQALVLQKELAQAARDAQIANALRNGAHRS